MPNYVKIPREIIYDKSIGNKRVIIFSYLCSRRALDDTVAFSISELCYWSHLKPNYHDGKINQKYLEVLESLSHYGYFIDHPDFKKIAKEKKNLRVNMNRNSDKPLCCYRLYQKISEDIGLSERYISRIVEILDVMNIVKHKEGKRTRYTKSDGNFGFLTAPKIFADYRHFIKDEYGNPKLDSDYDFEKEIQKQIEILE